MNVEQITEKEISFFFNKYKYNCDQIFHLERRLLSEAYDYDQWEKMLNENSRLTRSLFAENESLIEEYICPVLNNPELLSSDAVHSYILHITFFLFENNLDTLLTEEIINAILEKSKVITDSERFDANLCMGISKILQGIKSFEEAVSYIDEALKIFPTVNSVSDDLNLKLHVIFARTYKMVAFNLLRNPDCNSFLEVYDQLEKDIKCGDTELYKLMWDDSSDYESRINLLLRLFKYYGIYILTFAGFTNERLISWLEEEFALEESEGLINPMIFTLHTKLLFHRKTITLEEYKKALVEKMYSINVKQDYSHTEGCFPDDNDPIPEQIALLHDRTKLFNSTFTYANVLLPELLLLCKEDEQMQSEIIHRLSIYYGYAKYAAKGFQTDQFVIRNFLAVAEYFNPPREMIPFLQTIMVHREINSSIHFVMVSNLSAICLSHLIDKAPELFITKEYPDSQSVLENRNKLLRFIKYAGLLHDIGKIGRTNFVNLHFRRITDYEYSELKQHTKIGFEITNQISYLKKYSYFSLYHHKYYDSEKGYPEDVNSSKFEYKTFLDIISICDTLDTSTDYKGRNYAKFKTFDDIFEEIKEMKDRYNPQLIKMIEEDEALKEELRYMTTTGRNYISFEIFHKYVQPHTDISADSEKTVEVYNKDWNKNLEVFISKVYGYNKSQVQSFIHEKTKNTNYRIFVLIDQKNQIYGILCGKIGEKSKKDFYITDYIVQEEYRNRGWGTQLLITAENLLKGQGLETISTSIPPKKIEGFFWIEGFLKKNDYMQKNI